MTNEALNLAHEELKHIKAWCLRSLGIGLVNENVLAKIEEALAQDALQALHDENKSLGLYEPEQEPVAWALFYNGYFIDAIDPDEHARVEGQYKHPLYTTPPQRKPLTDEQIDELFSASLKAGEGHSVTDWVRRIEAAHGIKGEA